MTSTQTLIPKTSSAAPFLPMSRAEMQALGWDECDVVIVTGDAYVDHPSFGMAIIGRVLEAQGLRVGIIAQPDWQSAEAFRALGRPRLFFGITAGNMDSMVNRYTSERRLRHNDAYTPDGEGGRRPDRAVVVYAQRCREAYKGVPIVLGGIEAILRRVAHYDYWSDKLRRSVVLDAKADLVLYGNAERAVVDLARRLNSGEAIGDIDDLRGTLYARSAVPESWEVKDASHWDSQWQGRVRTPEGRQPALRLPSLDDVSADKVAYAHASRVVHAETNPHNARALVQAHRDREVCLLPPPIPLTTEEMDAVYALPFRRLPHPSYGKAKIPAYDMIRFSISIQRGCFGGCSFCSITEHEGRIIQSRSAESVLAELERLREEPGYTGVVSDLGGPTANMWRLGCKSPKIEAACRRPSCLFPKVCSNLRTDHGPLIDLYRAARQAAGVKRVNIASGVRYDLAVEDPAYIRELVEHHVGGYLKIAPEHVAERPLAAMMKPGIGAYERFERLFNEASAKAGKKQFLIPYFIAAHPDTTDEDMLEVALWLKKHHYKLEQVQTFLPSPMSSATAMWHTGKNPLSAVSPTSAEVVVPAGERVRRLHKAFLRVHDPEGWPLIREGLIRMGRRDLIGGTPSHLVPAHDKGPRRGGEPGAGKGPAKRR